MNQTKYTENIRTIKDTFLNKSIDIDILKDENTDIYNLFKKEIQKSYSKFDIREYNNDTRSNMNNFYENSYNHTSQYTTIKETVFYQIVKDYPRTMNLFLNSKEINIDRGTSNTNFNKIGNELKDIFKSYNLNNKNSLILFNLLPQQGRQLSYENLNKITITNLNLSSGDNNQFCILSKYEYIFENYYINIINNNIIFLTINYYYLKTSSKAENIMTIAVVTYVNISQNKYIVSFIYMDSISQDNLVIKKNNLDMCILEKFNSKFYIHKTISIFNRDNIFGKKFNLIKEYLGIPIKSLNDGHENINIDIEDINSTGNNTNTYREESYITIKFNGLEIVKVYLFSSIRESVNDIYFHIVNINTRNVRLLKTSNNISNIDGFLNNLLKNNIILNKSYLVTPKQNVTCCIDYYTQFNTNNYFNTNKNYINLIKNIKKIKNLKKNEFFRKTYNNFIQNNSIQEKSDFLLINLDELNKNNSEIYFYYIIIKIIIENPKIIVICSQYSEKIKNNTVIEEPNKKKYSQGLTSYLFNMAKKSFSKSNSKSSHSNNSSHSSNSSHIGNSSHSSSSSHSSNSSNNELRQIIQELRYKIINSIKNNGLETSIYTFTNDDSFGYGTIIDDDIKCLTTTLIINDINKKKNYFIIYNLSSNSDLNRLNELIKTIFYEETQSTINNIFLCGNIVNNHINVENNIITSILNSRVKNNQHNKTIHYLLKKSNNKININENNFKRILLGNNTILEVLSLSLNL